MGIQINGQTDSISAIDGSLTFSTSSVQQVADINATGIITAASANFTGNVSVGGTLTYQDVTNIDSVGIITARAGVKVPDSQKIFVGTGNDLQIFHDGNHSYVKDGGNGSLILLGDDVLIKNTAETENKARFHSNGNVELYYDNSKKFETTSGGVEVSSGNLTMQSNGRIFVGNGGNAVNPMFANVSDTNTGIAFPSADTMLFATGGSERLRITSAGRVGVNINSPNTVLDIKSTQNSDGLTVTKGSNVSAFLGHNGSGDEGLLTLKEGGTTKIQLYAETNQNSYINSGNFGIGETSPYYKLHLKTNNNATSLSGGGSGNWGGDGIRIENENTTGGSMSLAHFRTYDADWHIGNKYVGANNSDFIFSSEGNERLRITSDGKMGVGTASPNHRLTLHNSGTGTFDALNITSGLTNSVGLQFGIDSASNVFFWHTANGGIKFATNNVERARVTNNGITFNGDTAADNALNDYEQGTWNPTIAFGGSSTGVSYSERQGIYVKIGNLVWASIVISLTNNGSGTGDVSITLPFTVGSNSENRGIGTLAYFAGFAGLNSNPNIYASSGGATTCRLQHLNNGGGGNGTQVTTLTHGNISNTAGIRGAIMYTTI